MSIALYVMAGWLVAGVLLTIASIGKPRKPLEPGVAAFILLVDAAWIVLLVLAARRLS